MSLRVNFRIFRYKQDDATPHYDDFSAEVQPDDFILDIVERIWATQDHSLVFRHSCHHATCGSCGIRVNGREKLACITTIASIATNGSTVTLQPLQNLPVISDLLVDMEPFYAKMEQIQFAPVRTAETIIDETLQAPAENPEPAYRLEDCIECGICLSACPIVGTDPAYLGPAALAGIWRMIEEPRRDVNPEFLSELSDSTHGLWRCHGAFECSEVCPGNVDPAAKIMALRRRVLSFKLNQLVKSGSQ